MSQPNTARAFGAALYETYGVHAYATAIICGQMAQQIEDKDLMKFWAHVCDTLDSLNADVQGRH